MSAKPLRVVDYDSSWPERFAECAADLRVELGPGILRIDHIGSTSVPGLAAKDVIDIQVTVGRLRDADAWPDELLPELSRRAENDRDHVPAGLVANPCEWAKRMWSRPSRVHLHVREQGRANQRYALLFRDYLRSDANAAGAYQALKRALAERADDDWDLYYAVKDPACDLILAGAEQWAARHGWTPGPPDA